MYALDDSEDELKWVVVNNLPEDSLQKSDIRVYEDGIRIARIWYKLVGNRLEKVCDIHDDMFNSDDEVYPINGRFYIYTSDGIYFSDSATKSRNEWVYVCDGERYTIPRLCNGYVVIGTSSGLLKLDRGEVVETFPCPANLSSGTIVWNPQKYGICYETEDTGKLCVCVDGHVSELVWEYIIEHTDGVMCFGSWIVVIGFTSFGDTPQLSLMDVFSGNAVNIETNPGITFKMNHEQDTHPKYFVTQSMTEVDDHNKPMFVLYPIKW